MSAEFRGAMRAAVRGLGSARRAAPLHLEALARLSLAGPMRPDAGPADFADFVLVGVWWLLREVEAAGLSVDAVTFDNVAGPVALQLGATKSDIQGRGVVRAHRCICGVNPQWSRLCPHCALHRQLNRRVLAGALPEAPLFPDVVSGAWVAKRVVVEQLRQVFAASSGADVDGHSMRRTGAQLLTKSGVAP